MGVMGSKRLLEQYAFPSQQLDWTKDRSTHYYQRSEFPVTGGMNRGWTKERQQNQRRHLFWLL